MSFGGPGFWILEEPTLSALISRLARQQEKVTRLNFGWVKVSSKESAEAFKTLMEASSEVAIEGMELLGAIGGEGWKVLAEGVRLHPGLHLDGVNVEKDDLDEASQEDIRVLWDALKTGSEFSVLDPSLIVIVSKEEGEDGWTRLTQIIEMSKEDWAAQVDDECGAEEEEEGSDLVA